MKIDKINRNEIDELIIDYYTHLTAPMDDMYDEGIIPSCDFYRISNNEKVCGFLALNDENVLLQFYLNEEERESLVPIFDEIIAHLKIEKALCYSNDPLYYNQCKRKASTIVNHDFMFHEASKIESFQPFDGILMEHPIIDKLEEILSYFEGIGMDGDWLRFYLTKRLETKSIFLFRFNGVIIGTGEMRPSSSNAEYANVGMTVASDFRKRGLGQYILSTMRMWANNRGLKAICSTDNGNAASYKTIIKSGFTCYHKIEEITFKKVKQEDL